MKQPQIFQTSAAREKGNIDGDRDISATVEWSSPWLAGPGIEPRSGHFDCRDCTCMLPSPDMTVILLSNDVVF